MFIPKKEVLGKYASILVEFALNSGKGINKGDVVYLSFDQIASALAIEIYSKIIEKGGNCILKPGDYRFSKIFFEKANNDQLTFFPEKYNKALINTLNHYIRILADVEPDYLKNVNPEKIIKANTANKKMREWMDKKEDSGNFTWTLGLYATDGMAKEAGLTLEEYWEQIIKACFLNESNPIKKWENVYSEINYIISELNKLEINKIRIESKKTDLEILMGESRKFIGGSGRNIPSFEIFTSPDFRGTNGTIFFDYPLYRYGNIIRNISLTFQNGVIVKAYAEQNQKLLLEMIKQKNADKIGEFSLTDIRFSKIDKFMANTLYDENFGGDYGNTHIALGKSYHDTYSGNASSLSKKDWLKLGFNDSAEHCDIISTQNRKVTAILKNNSSKVIYEDGKFKI